MLSSGNARYPEKNIVLLLILMFKPSSLAPFSLVIIIGSTCSAEHHTMAEAVAPFNTSIDQCRRMQFPLLTVMFHREHRLQ